MSGGADDSATRTRSRNRRSWLVNIALLIAVFLLVHWWQTKPLASGPAPALTGRLVSGQSFDLTELRGKPVLVHFWATWCPVCKAEQGTIQSLSEELAVISVAMQSGDAEAVRGFMEQEELGFPALPDPYGEIAGNWGVHSVPTSFVVDAGGTIRFSEVGFTTGPGLRARIWAAKER